MRNVTVIQSSKVLAIAARLGLNVSTKTNETKVFGASLSNAIAIPNTKGGATRIYCVGFAPKEGTVAHPKPPAKTVTVMFDHSLPEKELLSAIYKAAKVLASSMPKPEVKPATEAPASTPEAELAGLERASLAAGDAAALA